MSYLPLSKVKQWIPLEEIALFCIDNGYAGIINNLTPTPHIEYDLNDLVRVWDKFKPILQ